MNLLKKIKQLKNDWKSFQKWKVISAVGSQPEPLIRFEKKYKIQKAETYFTIPTRELLGNRDYKIEGCKRKAIERLLNKIEEFIDMEIREHDNGDITYILRLFVGEPE
jgi:hypothetical protein